jgi:hypothetical protein
MNVEELDVDTIYMYSREWLMNRVMWYFAATQKLGAAFVDSKHN